MSPASGGHHLVLDTGALIALERSDLTVRSILRRARDRQRRICIPAPVVAQAWRGGPRQTVLARLLGSPDVEVPALDRLSAIAVGVLSGRSGHPDIVDVHVVVWARQVDGLVLTSDPDDLRRVDPGVRLVTV